MQKEREAGNRCQAEKLKEPGWFQQTKKNQQKSGLEIHNGNAWVN